MMKKGSLKCELCRVSEAFVYPSEKFEYYEVKVNDFIWKPHCYCSPCAIKEAQKKPGEIIAFCRKCGKYRVIMPSEERICEACKNTT